jgi:DNA-binding NarL/FixJ family response regulator
MTPSQELNKIQAIRVILAEDHQVVRSGIRALLEKQRDIVIAGEAGSGEEVLELLKQGISADLILSDIHMPVMNGIEMIEQLKQTLPHIKIIILSMLDNEKFIVKAFRAGASAYLLKNAAGEELVFAIHHVYAGGEYVCAEVSMRLLRRLVKTPDLINDEQPSDLQLSERDLEVLHLIAEGHTNQEMADKLFTSKRTVEGYRQQLMNKTGTRNTAALINFAFTHNLLK